jgi:hypothetical protein
MTGDLSLGEPDDTTKIFLAETCLLAMTANAAREMRMFHVVLSKVNSCLFDVYFKNTRQRIIEKICKLASDVGFWSLVAIPYSHLDILPLTVMLKGHNPQANV